MLGQGGPHDHHGTECRAEPHCPVALIRAPGNEIRPSQHIAQTVGEHERGHGMCAGLAVALVAVGQLAAQHLGCLPPHDAHHAGVKAFKAVGAGVGLELCEGHAAKLLKIGLAVLAAALDLNDQRRGGVGLGHRAQHIGKERRMLLTARQRQGGEMRPVHIMHKALGRCHTVQRIIVKNNQPMVRCKLDIQLDAVAVLRCGGKGGQAVLRRALVLAEKAAVGVIAPVERQAQLVTALAGPDGEQCQQY